MSGLTPRGRVMAVAADDTGPEWQRRWLEATNNARAAAGKSAYRPHSRLNEVARLRVEDMLAENYFGHADPRDDPARIDGKYNEILLQLGATTWLWAGENLAMNNYADPLTEAMRGLLASPTHRANILADDFDSMGSWSAIRADGLFVFATIFAGGLA